jgi:hypothetical protein
MHCTMLNGRNSSRRMVVFPVLGITQLSEAEVENEHVLALCKSGVSTVWGTRDV